MLFDALKGFKYNDWTLKKDAISFMPKLDWIHSSPLLGPFANNLTIRSESPHSKESDRSSFLPTLLKWCAKLPLLRKSFFTMFPESYSKAFEDSPLHENDPVMKDFELNANYIWQNIKVILPENSKLTTTSSYPHTNTLKHGTFMNFLPKFLSQSPT